MWTRVLSNRSAGNEWWCGHALFKTGWTQTQKQGDFQVLRITLFQRRCGHELYRIVLLVMGNGVDAHLVFSVGWWVILDRAHHFLSQLARRRVMRCRLAQFIPWRSKISLLQGLCRFGDAVYSLASCKGAQGAFKSFLEPSAGSWGNPLSALHNQHLIRSS